MVIAVMITPVGQSAVEAATKRNGRVFAAYIVLLLITAMLVAYFTWLTWDSGNKVQDAVQGEANARIEEAKATAAQADERSKALEKDNLILRGDLNTETGKVAGLQTDAANAKAEQQEVQIELAKQQVKAAEAEKNLLELKERIKPRRLTDQQAKDFVAILKKIPNRAVKFGWTIGGGDEGFGFLSQLVPLFKEAGWTVTNEGKDIDERLDMQVTGIGILVPNTEILPPATQKEIPLTPLLFAIQAAFKTIDIDVQYFVGPKSDTDTPEIMVGSKPNPKF
jgi:hypothetical protein